MKKILILVLTLLSFSVTSQNYSFFENDVRFVDGNNKDEVGNSIVTLTHFGFFPISDKFGFTDYASIEGNDRYSYGQVMLGGYYNITDKLSAYVMSGLESVTNEARFGYMLYYTTGDEIRTYAFYQRNQNPFSSDTKSSEWYDFLFRYAIKSTESSSVYVAARYMRGYGLGVPFIFREKLSNNSNIYVGFTSFYDVDKLLPEWPWVYSLSLSLEFF